MMKEREKTFRDVEDLEVYQKLCQLHLEVCDISHEWPAEERYELGSQIRRASNSSPAQLAEKNDDRHLKNKVEGVNRSRGEAGETVHHLFIAQKKKYVSSELYDSYRERYKECIRMLNGLEKSLEIYLPEKDRRWLVAEEKAEYVAEQDLLPSGWPSDSEDASRPFLNTEH